MDSNYRWIAVWIYTVVIITFAATILPDIRGLVDARNAIIEHTLDIGRLP